MATFTIAPHPRLGKIVSDEGLKETISVELFIRLLDAWERDEEEIVAKRNSEQAEGADRV